MPPQRPPQQPQQVPQEPIRAEVQLVNLFVTVRDKNKRIVTDLTKDDFRVFEDGQEQRVEFFSRETALPITLGLLVDTSISQGQVLSEEQAAASRFLERVVRRGDLAFVISFDVNVDLLSDFTDSTEQLEAAVHRTRINAPLPEGPVARSGPVGTKLYDAIWLACREKLRREAGRKALVILSDGVDAGSDMKLEDALAAAQRTDTVIHFIVISDPGYYGFGGPSGGGVARKLAEETGGRAIFVRDEKKLDEAFDQISEELRNQYMLGYYSTNNRRDGKFRKVQVKINRSGMKVLARKGYYAAGSSENR
jgi:VWFA-related protein